MAFITQARLQQMSGSLGSGNDITAAATMTAAGSALADVSAADVAEILQVFGDSLAHIHGKSDFTSQTPGLIQAEDGNNYDLKLDQNDAGQAILLESAGTIQLDSAGNTTIESSAGTISVGADAVAQAINVGTGAAARTISVGNETGATALDFDAGTGGVAIDAQGAGTIVLGGQTDTGAISIGAAASARVITVGNVTGATQVVLNAGTAGIALASTGAGDITLDSDDTLLLDSDGVLELNSSAGAISIGSDSIAQKISVGADTSTRTEVELNAILLDLNAGSGGATIDAAGASHLKTTSGALTVSGSAAGSLQFGTTLDIDSQGAMTIDSAAGISLDAGAASNLTTSAGALTLDGAAGVSIEGNASEVDITTTGAIDINGAAITIDGTGTVSIDGADDMNFTITSGEAGEDLTIAQVGGNDSSILITAAGTGADAVSIDATAGSMVVAPSLADGQTLKIGPSSATQLVFTPHGTPASEKISLTNTAGTADDAISLVATAGGVKVQAGDDSLHLDADGTDADALNIDSAGGMDVDVAGVLDLNAGDDSVIAVTTAAKDLALTVSGGGAQVLQLNSAGTGTDAIDINATAGGMDVDVNGALDVAAGDDSVIAVTTAAKDLALTVSGGGAQVLQLNSAGTGTDAIDVNATAGGIDVDAQLGVHVSAGNGGSSGDITFKTAASSGMFIISGSSSGFLDIGSSAGLQVYKASKFEQTVSLKSNSGGTPTLFMSGNNLIKCGQEYDGHQARMLQIGKFDSIGGSGRNRMLMSASNPSNYELAFGGTGGNMTQDIIDLGSPTEFATFVGQSLFTSGVSIIGAFNALAEGIDSNYATLYKNTLSSSVASGQAFPVTKAVGPDTSLSSHNEARARLYLNGQLLSSASSGGQGGDVDNTVTGGDYVVVGDSSTLVRFAFALKSDDLLKVITVGA